MIEYYVWLQKELYRRLVAQIGSILPRLTI